MVCNDAFGKELIRWRIGRLGGGGFKKYCAVPYPVYAYNPFFFMKLDSY